MRRMASRIYNRSTNWFNSYHNLNVVIGSAKQGPSLTPIFVTNIEQLMNLYEIFGQKSDLVNAAYEAFDGSSPYCFINLSGRHREIDFGGLFKLISIGCDTIYNAYNFFIASADDTTYFCIDNGNSSPLVQYPIDTGSLGTLIAKINADALLRVIPFYCEIESAQQDLPASNLKEIVPYKNATNNNTEFFGDDEKDSKRSIVDKKATTDNSYLDLEDDLKQCLYDLAVYNTLTISIMNFRYDHVLSQKIPIFNFKLEYQEEDQGKPRWCSAKVADTTMLDTNQTYYIFVNQEKIFSIKPIVIEKEQCLFEFIESSFEADDESNNDESNSEESHNEESNNNANYLKDLESATCIYNPQDSYLYELLAKISTEKTTYAVPTFFNIGIPYNQISSNENDEYVRFLEFYHRLDPAYLDPFINIIIDSFKTSLYSEENNPYLSNGVPLVTRAINSIMDFDGITGFTAEAFREYNPIITNDKKLFLNQQGVLTTNLLKDGRAVLSCSANLLKTQNKIMSDVSNSYLIRDIIQNISARLTSESSNGEIRTTIDTLMSENYSDVIRKYNLDIESNLEKKEINRAVRLELYVVGFIKGLQAIIYLG